MRVATTEHGKKLHLIDPNTADRLDSVTCCGRTKIFWVNIIRPVKKTVCQTCVRVALARMTKLLAIIPGIQVVKGEIRPSQSSSQKKLKRTKGRGSRK